MKLLGDYLLHSGRASFIIKENTAPYRTRRNFKDQVFRLLFSETETAWELFCALEGDSYAESRKTDKSLLKLVTLQDVLGSHKLNDLAFQYAQSLLSIVEHQSSWSENMPLRELIYLSKTYEKILDMRKLYQKKLCKIPMPHLYVLYNGEEDRPSETIQRLSDAFCLTQGIPWGDFQVIVININYDKQHPLLSRCRTLQEYSLFVQQVRSYLRQEGVNRDEALRRAVRTCIEQDILKSFLENHRSEVENMLFDITEEEFLEIRAAEMAEDLAVEMAEKKAVEIAKKLVEERMRELTDARIEELAEAKAEKIVQEKMAELLGAQL